MKEWCLEHPYMTTLLALFLMSTAMNVLNKFLDLFKKTPTTTVNLNLEKQDEDYQGNFTNDNDLN